MFLFIVAFSIFMDFIAHLLWSMAIFWGPQVYLAMFFGVMPDLLPFGSNLIIGRFRNKGRKMKYPEDLFDYYRQPQNKWVYKFYNWTHSLVIWALSFMIAFIIERIQGSFPYYMFAWLLHVIMDIPTHTKAFFAPQFLTPLSKFCVDGKSWAYPAIMALNYGSLILFVVLRFVVKII